MVAPEVSVLLVVVELEGCEEAAAWLPAPNEPPTFNDSPARESDVTVPAFSTLGLLIPSLVLVTYLIEVRNLLDRQVVNGSNTLVPEEDMLIDLWKLVY